MQGVWLICVWQGRWVVRLDLKPSEDQDVAISEAERQTKMSGRRHKAIRALSR